MGLHLSLSLSRYKEKAPLAEIRLAAFLFSLHECNNS